MGRLKGLILIEAKSLSMVYGPQVIEAIGRRVDFVSPPQTRESMAGNSESLRDVEVIFGGWGMPRIDAAFLDCAPKLQAIFYAAGAADAWCSPAVWERGITVTTAIQANSIPVAEYTLATILFSLKHGWSLARQTRRQRTFPDRNGAPGAFESTVGIVSLGSIARHLIRMLRPFDLRIIAHDPYVNPADARAMNVELVTLEELFRRSDVVSLQTPELPETRGLITGRHIASMKRGATFINTSRGAIVREEEMLDVLERRDDLQAVLDTVQQEPPASHSRLYSLENVVLTPHIAGSVGHECQRMARYMVSELERYVRGEPLQWALKPPVPTRGVDCVAADTAQISQSMTVELAVAAKVVKPKRVASMQVS